MIIVALLAFLFGLCLIISLHELGHFMFAKKYNVLCYDYSIGMGPLIYGKKKGETQYGIRAIPLGGFVAMADGNMSNALLDGEDVIVGINVDENNIVTEIILNDVKESLFRGKVIDKDLYCEDGKNPFITIEVDGENKTFEVKKDAMIYIKPKKAPMQIATYDRCFESKTKWQRFVMLFAGPGMNFILAIFLFIIAGLFIGKASNKPIIGSLEEKIEVKGKEYGSPAYAAGLRKGDKIIKINDTDINKWEDIEVIEKEVLKAETVNITYMRNDETLTATVRPIVYLGNLGVIGNFEEHKDDNGATIFIYTTKAEKAGLANNDTITKIDDVEITSWSDLIAFCQDKENDGKTVNVTVVRDGKELEKPIKVSMLKESTVKGINDLEMLGAKIQISPKYHFDFFYSFAYSFKSFGKSITSVWNTLRLLFTSKDVKVSDLSGPVGIFTLIKNSLTGGVINYIYFLGFLSVNIGIVNLLPIPALDGGRIVFVGVEAVTRKKVNKKFEDTLTTIVFFLLMGLLIYITFNDILRLRG